jgi:hypothetical protein
VKSAPHPVQLDAVPLKIEGVGQLARRKDGSVTWTAVNGDEATLSFDDDRLLFHYAADPGLHLVVLASQYASEVYTLEGARGARVRMEEKLHRFEDTVGGLRYFRLVSLPKGALLVYEQGLSRFNEAGWLQWRAEHYRIDWSFDHIDAETVWLHDQERPVKNPDRTVIGYRLEDGAKVRRGGGVDGSRI